MTIPKIISNFPLTCLYVLIMLATAPIFAHAQLSGKVQSTQTVTVADPVWREETTYLEKSYPSRPYYNKTVTYTTVEPAYRYGYDLYAQDNDVAFDQLDQAKLKADWMAAHPGEDITWDEAFPAIRDSYTHVYEIHHPNGSTTVVHETHSNE